MGGGSKGGRMYLAPFITGKALNFFNQVFLHNAIYSRVGKFFSYPCFVKCTPSAAKISVHIT